MINLKSGNIICLLSVVLAFNIEAKPTLEIDRDLTDNTNAPVIPIIPLTGDSQYQFTGSQLNVNSKHAVICNRVSDYVPVSNIRTRILDPNGENKGDKGGLSLMGVKYNINYNVRKRAFNLETEFRSKSICLSSEIYDVIYEDGFADEPVVNTSDISYNFINEPANGYTPGSIMSYEVIYQNNTGSSLLLDLIEYHAFNSGSPAYFVPGGNINCSILDASDQQISTCFSSNGVVSNVDLLSGQKIKLAFARQISQSAVVGSNLEMMTAIFSKISTIDSAHLGSNQSFAGFEMNAIKVPIVANN